MGDWIVSSITTGKGQVLLLVKDLADSTSAVELRADSSGRIITLSNSHFKIHQGDYYSSGYYATGITAGSSIQLIMNVSSTHQAHTSIKVKHGIDATLQVYEGVTYTGGTTVTPQNNNRASTNTSTMTFVHTPTTPSGTMIWQEYFPGGSGPTSPGATGTSGEQTVLKPSTTYMFELTNTGSVTDELQIILAYYEVAV